MEGSHTSPQPFKVWGGHRLRHTSKKGTRPVSVSGAHFIDLLELIGTPEWIRTTDLLLRRERVNMYLIDFYSCDNRV